jgi:hypothetical protein
MLAVASAHDAHHHVGNETHELFHHIGQAHEHDDDNETDFKISYSKESQEHANANHDGGFVGVFCFFDNSLFETKPEVKVTSILSTWSSPFIKYDTPPPKF